MVVGHYGSTEIIRQCITPGMYIEHKGETYIASANKIEAHKLFARNFTTQTCITDSMVKVWLDRNGLPMTAEQW
ncbi:cell division protein FtsZ [Escherichia coli]|nr:cell division protein FtsZ [Escherichia coli]MED8993504.1 cell division protein FtsZ [Escherichia coli]HAY0383302.1 cell division protein FtsZ [Escherichia coli]HEM0052875.1 cell division protein FtsZ [Escherichia coli]